MENWLFRVSHSWKKAMESAWDFCPRLERFRCERWFDTPGWFQKIALSFYRVFFLHPTRVRFRFSRRVDHSQVWFDYVGYYSCRLETLDFLLQSVVGATCAVPHTPCKMVSLTGSPPQCNCVRVFFLRGSFESDAWDGVSEGEREPSEPRRMNKEDQKILWGCLVGQKSLYRLKVGCIVMPVLHNWLGTVLSWLCWVFQRYPGLINNASKYCLFWLITEIVDFFYYLVLQLTRNLQSFVCKLQ